MDGNRYEADALADLEQQLFPEAVARLRRWWCAAAAAVLAGTLSGLALLGLSAIPLLLVLAVSGGLVAVSRVTPLPAPRPPSSEPPAAPRPATPSSGAAAQPRGCSTKS